MKSTRLGQLASNGHLSEQSERARLTALRDCDILYTQPEYEYNRLVDLAVRLFEVPISVVGFVEEKMTWFKARAGLESHFSVLRNQSFCDLVVQQNRLLVVNDAREVADSGGSAQEEWRLGLASSPVDAVFFAGVPVYARGHEPVGALCILDTKPRILSGDQVRLLEDLADLASQAVTLRSQEHLIASQQNRIAALEGDKITGGQQLPQYAEDQTITLCSWTKRVRQHGEWISVEQFLRHRFGLQVSHGLSKQAMLELESTTEELSSEE